MDDKQVVSTETVAIIIGVSSYMQETLVSLPAAEVDAVNFARALRNWGIPEDHILLFLNHEIDEEKIEALFECLSKKFDKYKFIFYFCGHGHRTLGTIPKSYLIFHDSHCQPNVCTKALELDSFFEKIAKMNILESYIFIDACQLRVNHFVHPKLADEIRGGPSSPKSLFCLLSSGIEASFESIDECTGYFTQALLKSLSHLRLTDGSLTQFLSHMQNEMKVKHLPPPEMINFGSQKISLLSTQNSWMDDEGCLYRAKLIAEIQDILIQNHYKVIVLYGDEGIGKTTLCHLLTSIKTKTVFLKIPLEQDELFDPIDFLESEMIKKVGCSLRECDLIHPYSLILIDQVERLSEEKLQRLFATIFQCARLRFICTSREPLKERVQSDHLLFDLSIPPFSQEEGELLIHEWKPNYSQKEIRLTYLMSCGNPLRIEKLVCMDVDFKNIEFEELKKAIGAAYSCGIYYDRGLFEAVFNLQEGILEFLEREGLILSFKQGFIPHSIVNRFAELEELTVDSQTILSYWCQQSKSIPDNPEIAKSLILTIKCFGYQKNLEKDLQRAIQSLEISQENLHYFIDGAEILLSLPYPTRMTAYLAKVLKKLGENELSAQLSNSKKSRFSLATGLICLSLVTTVLLSFMLWSGPKTHMTHVHVKQTHPDFVGRENYLRSIESKIVLERAPDTVPVVVLWGEGGIGKSEIAIAAANQQLNHFDLVYWINAATDESFLASYRQLATQLNLFVAEHEMIDDLVSKVHDHLENHPELAWLLIYDNADKEYELPQRGNGAVLVTTRDQNAWRLYPHYEVTGFLENEALALFRKITLKEKSESLIALIKELDNYPLSLNLVAHYIAETPWMPEESYVELLSMDKVGFLQRIPTDRRYPNALLNSWRMTADQLHAKFPKALDWLHFSSYLHPDQIPCSWIQDWIQQNSKDPLDPYSLKVEMNEILRLVVNQALIRFDKRSKNLSMHRLKQEIFRYDDHFDPQTKEKVLHFLVHSQSQVDSLEKYEAYGEMDMKPEIWPKLRAWEAHAAWFLEKHSDSCSKVDLAILNGLLGSWKTINSEFEQAESYINESLKIRLELFGKEDLRTVVAMGNKAVFLWRMNQLEESKTMHEEALAILEKIAPNDPYYYGLISLGLALVFEKLQDYETMKTLSEKNVDIAMKAYGEKHLYTTICLNFLATAHLNLKEYNLAQTYFARVLQFFISEYNRDHPLLSVTMCNLGRMFSEMGEYEQAEKFFIQAINIYDKYYGKGQAFSARFWHFAGQAREKLGKEEEAFEALKKAFCDLRKAYKKDHPFMIELIEDLARLSEKVGNQEMIEEIRKFKLLNNASVQKANQ